MTIPKLNDYSLPTQDQLPYNRVSWTMDPKRSVLLIHDMQQYFINFWQANCSLIKQVIHNIRQLRQQCDQLRIPVFYTAQPKVQSDQDRALLNDMWGPGITLYPEQQQIVAELAPRASDQVLTKWRYSAFHRSMLASLMQEMGRDQLLITGVYAHIGCLTTATDAFMRNIQAFMVADALADFSAEKHQMALDYTAGRSGKVVMTEELLLLPDSQNALRTLILPWLDDDEIPEDEDNLIDYGLDSVRIMALAARWRQAIPTIDFLQLAKNPTIAAWWQRLNSGNSSHEV